MESKQNLKSFPELQSPRLLLRQPKISDLPYVTILANDPDISRNTSSMPFPYYEKNAVAWLNMAFQGFDSGERFIFAIELNATKQFIGGIGFSINKENNRAEIGYWLGREFWNKGYCSEALPMIIKFAFEEIKINKLIATHFPYNPASGKVLEKCGMNKEGEFKEYIKRKDQFFDLVHYGLTKKEYCSLKFN